MNEKDIRDALKTKEVDAPLFEERLRRVLLSKHPGKKGFAFAPHFLIRTLMNKYSVPFALLAVVVLGVTFNIVGMHTQTAQAQELAKRAFTRAIHISPEMRAKFEAAMKADMLQTLAEARAAKDLRILTPEEYEKEAQFTISTSTDMKFTNAVPPGGVKGMRTFGMAVKGPGPVKGAITVNTMAGGDTVGEEGPTTAPLPVTYLSYTNPLGSKVVLGLDKDDTPVFKIQMLSEKEMSTMGPDPAGIPGGPIESLHVEE